MYDIFYVSAGIIDLDDWKVFRGRFPSAQKIENVKSFNDIKNKSFTKFFWIVWNDLIIDESFSFDYVVTKWDEEYIHIWKNSSYYDGICLASKKHQITQREFEHRFFINKKEIDVVASCPKTFDKFYINSYTEYLQAVETTTSEMFWVIWNDVVVADDFNFDYYIPQYDSFHRNITHIFKNGEFYDGICLFSKNKPVTKKEFEHKFFINKKEVGVIASWPKAYDILYYDTYDEYLKGIVNLSSMVWLIPKEAKVLPTFTFDLYFSWHNNYDRNMNHVFLHTNGTDNSYNGIMLAPREKLLNKREIDFRFPIDKKEYPIVASKLAYEIVFISYKEPNAEENYKNLLSKFPDAKRVHGIKGIHQAHIEAAKIATTSMFWVVDGDAVVESNFNFDYPVSRHDRDVVHVWASKNPVNGLIYGYGGIKLLPRELVLNMKTDTKDMTLGISPKFKSMSAVSNITAFNTDPYNTWKSAFRECVKLASKVFDKDYDEQTDDRLATWCTESEDPEYGIYAIEGAKAGKRYGTMNLGNKEELTKINDFDWLESQFLEWKNNEQS